MVGLGLMIWLAAVNDWEGGAWGVPDRARLFDCMEIGKQKGHSASAAGTATSCGRELTDADLVTRVLTDDDQHAFGELVRGSSVRGLLRQLTRTDLALADDLLRRSFSRAVQKHP